jgi:carbon-monoxide dehydrogenase medium subunit
MRAPPQEIHDLKPPRFAYHAPASVDEAVALLARYGGDARVLSGGQSLVPMLNFRLVTPAALIDLRRIESLAYVREEGATVAIGSMTRQRAAERSPVVAAKLPLVTEALRWVGHLPTRSRGTVGGSIAHADPSAELPAMFLALGGEAVAVGTEGRRTIAADDFFQSFFTTALAPTELLAEVRFPAMAAGTGHAVEEFARRKGDFAIVGIAAVVVKDGGRARDVRLVAFGASGTPLRLRAAEQSLAGAALDATSLARAADAARGEVDPVADNNASADYRRHLVGVLVQRALARATGVTLQPEFAHV